MNSLEFIEKEINYLNELLLYHQKEYDNLQYDKGSIMQNFHLDQIKILNGNLVMMKQIKTELETHEILKDRLEKLEKENSNLFDENQELKQAVKFLEDTLVLSVETEKGTAISLDGNEISIEGYWLVQGDIPKIYLIYPKDYEILKKYLKSIGGE